MPQGTEGSNPSPSADLNAVKILQRVKARLRVLCEGFEKNFDVLRARKTKILGSTKNGATAPF